MFDFLFKKRKEQVLEKEKLENFKEKGNKGEDKTYSVIYPLFPEGTRFMRNITIPLFDKETEIDIVIISKQGILVLENKDYSGIIKGNQKTKTWQHISLNGEERDFYSPLWQNNTHIKTLNYHLSKRGLIGLPFTSRVVFSDNNVDLVGTPFRFVKTLHTIRKFIVEDYLQRPEIIDVEKIYHEINLIRTDI